MSTKGKKDGSNAASAGKYFENGLEYPSNVPYEPTVDIRPPSLTERVKEMVRSELFESMAEAAGHETFEDADDFDLEGEDFGEASPYEHKEFEGTNEDTYYELEVMKDFTQALKTFSEAAGRAENFSESPNAQEKASTSDPVDTPQD
jgi:hypothetical protein